MRASLGIGGGKHVALVELPVIASRVGLLHGVADKTVFEQHKGMSRCKRERRLGRSFLSGIRGESPTGEHS